MKKRLRMTLAQGEAAPMEMELRLNEDESGQVGHVGHKIFTFLEG